VTAPSPWVNYTWNGVDGWLWQGAFFIPKDVDPTTGTAVIFLAPPGGRGSIPGPAAGAGGAPSPPRNVTVNQVAPGGTIPQPVVTIIDPGGPGQPCVWDLTFWVYSGAAGPPVTVALLAAVDLTGHTTAQSGDYLVYEPGGSGVLPYMTFEPALNGGKFWPSVINSTTSANGPQRTLAQISIASRRFDTVAKVSGGALVVGTGPNVQVNLVARLNSPTGIDIGLGVGLAGQNPPPISLWDGPPPGSPSNHGLIPAGTAATIFLQAEQQSGTDSFSTSATTTRFSAVLERIS
jgi:hypothetical protein